jgi:hypothetical protein
MVKAKRVVDEREKVWKRLLGTHKPFEVNAIRIVESDIFAPQTIELKRVVALIGLHGTGKTLFLRMLEAAFGYTTPATVPPFVRGSDISHDPSEIKGIIEVELNTPNGRVSRRVNLEQPASERHQIWKEATNNSLEASYISPIYLFVELMLLYQDFRSYRPDEPAGKGKYVKDGKKLKAISHILGREYKQIWIYPEDMNEEEDRGVYIPYIKADTDRGTIDVSMMSQGELWVNYVLNWFLDDDIAQEGLALLDEPEAFLAARAQRPFVDQVARQALAKNLQIIVATHSPEVLARFPLENLLMCVAGNDGIHLIKPKSVPQIREAVGLQTPIRMLIVVEDELAKRILISLFTRYDRALIRETEIVCAGGAGQVRNGMEILRGAEKLVCLGVLDADERRSESEEDQNVFFLPGASSPEKELLSKANHNTTRTAARLNVSAEDFIAAVSLCRGLDHHYWIKTVAASLGFAEQIMTHELIQLWLEDIIVRKESEKLVMDIRSSFPASI